MYSLEPGPDSAQGAPHAWKTCWSGDIFWKWNVWSSSFRTLINAMFPPSTHKPQALEISCLEWCSSSPLTWNIDSVSIFRHVIVRTSPNHRYTFTLRTHPSVVPGSIAFSLPQVTQVLIYSLLFLKVIKESIHLKQASPITVLIHIREKHQGSIYEI